MPTAHHQRPRSRRRARGPRAMWVALSLMVSLTLTVPAVYLSAPHIERWQMMRSLTADDVAQRERALNYVVRKAGHGERVRQSAIARLSEIERDEHFRALARALDMAGVWRRPTVPDGPWLRWLAMIVDEPEPEVRLRAGQRLARLPDLADDARVTALLKALLGDEDADVRYNALAATAELAGAADDRPGYESLIASRAQDADPAVARKAWLLLGWLDPAHGYSANWREAEPAIAEAMLWASVQTNPDRPIAAAAALRDDEVSPRVRRAAAYALAFAEPAEAEAALLPVMQAELAGEAVDHIILWRAVLGVPHSEATSEALRQLTRERQTADVNAIDRLELAARHRTAEQSAYVIHHEPDEPPSVNPDVLRELAALERRWLEPNGWMPEHIEWTGPLPDMLRLVRVATMPDPDARDLRPLLRHEQSAMRDLACVVAVDRFDDDVLREVIGELLVDYHDGAKMAGAVLAGMTGLQRDLLRERAERQHNWAVGQMMRVGLWMQGVDPEMKGRAARLLRRDELPRTSLLLALLQREQVAALDYIFAPQGEPAMDLVELFDHYRWWAVLRRHLPADAPPFWWWADGDVQRLQIDVLRSWYVLRRQSLIGE